jgi:hypothetical protein
MIIGAEVKQTHVYEPSGIRLVILKQYITDNLINSSCTAGANIVILIIKH